MLFVGVEKPSCVNQVGNSNNSNNKHPLTAFFEEQFHEQTAGKNRVDGTKLNAFCTNICTTSE
jgi:hypothetical protein